MRLSPEYFYMEVLLTKIRSQVDKFAKFNVHGDAILYTTKDDAKKQRAIGVQEGKRIFEDLFGPVSLRWVKGAGFKSRVTGGKAHGK